MVSVPAQFQSPTGKKEGEGGSRLPRIKDQFIYLDPALSGLLLQLLKKMDKFLEVDEKTRPKSRIDHNNY